MNKPKKQSPKKAGPKPETINIEGDVDWTDALKHAMSKPKPKDGWPGGNEAKGKKKDDKES